MNGTVASDTTGVGTARTNLIAAASYDGDKAIFAHGSAHSECESFNE